MNFYDRVYTLLLEWSSMHPIGKFDKKSPLTPQDHGLEGWAPEKEAESNFGSMKAKIEGARDQNKDIAYGREGNVKHTGTEKLARAYAKKLAKAGKGWKGRVIGFNLEHPDYDPDIKGNKGEKIAARRVARLAIERGKFDKNTGKKEAEDYGKKIARQGTEYAFSGDPEKRDDEKSYAQSDFKADEPTEWEEVQRDRNRLRRRGAARTARDQEKKGRVVIGTYGSGHWRDEN